MFKTEVLEFCKCPACGGRISHHKAKLQCNACGNMFEVLEDTHIPSFASASDIGFDERWRKHPAPQPTPVEQFITKTGLPPGSLDGKVFLDAGCGIGRYCQFAVRNGAKQAIGLDISPSGLAAAQKNCPEALLIQGDLSHIPVRDESIDIAISIGVLHHLPSTKEGFKQVAKTIKPGGIFAVWVYTNPVLDQSTLPMVELLHDITRACPPEKLYEAIKKHAVKIRETYYPAWGPLQQVMRPAYNPDDEQCISDMFDWHTPQYRWHHTYEEVASWFSECGFDVIWKGDFPVSMTGKKRI